jgi:hypothetical protein
MKRVLLFLYVLLLTAGSASAQTGTICLYSDEAGTQCNIVDNGGLVQVYIFHQHAGGVTGSRFMLDLGGLPWSHLGDIIPFPSSGFDINRSSPPTVIAGIEIGYGSCLPSPIHVATSNFFGSSAPADAIIRIVADPASLSGEIEAVDCHNNRHTAGGGTAYVNSTLPCVCDYNPGPLLSVYPSTINLGETETSGQFNIANVGEQPLSWTISESIPWLDVSPASGTDDGTVTVTVDRTGMPAGDYSGQIGVSSNGGNATVTVNMTVPVTEPVLSVTPTALNFGENAAAMNFDISNVGVGVLSWTTQSNQPWLGVSPAGGTDDGTVTVTVDRAGMPAGDYSGQIDVSSNGGNESVTVTMAVPADPPVLSVAPTAIDFGSTAEAANFYIYNVGAGVLGWNIQSDQPWLVPSQSSGSTSIYDTQISIRAYRAGLVPGIHTGNLFVTSNGGNITVPVSMEVLDPVLEVQPLSMSFGDVNTGRRLEISNEGHSELNWTISADQPWLSAEPVSGVNDESVVISVDRTGLGDGFYSGNLFVSSAGGDATIPVDMWVGVSPILSVHPVTLVYNATVITQAFDISNTGTSTLEWALSADQSWIEIVPPLAGTDDATITVSVDPALVPAGDVQTGYVTVSSNAGDASVEIRFVRQVASAAGSIKVFSDQAASSCNFVDTGGLVQVHFFHMDSDGATASQWKLDLGGLPWSHLGDQIWPPPIGTSITGVAIGYGACWAAPIYLGQANFFGSNAPACSFIRIVPDPDALSGQIEGVDCAVPANRTYPTGGYGRVNPDVTCPCGPVPVQHTTWGAIKAMYEPD